MKCSEQNYRLTAQKSDLQALIYILDLSARTIKQCTPWKLSNENKDSGMLQVSDNKFHLTNLVEKIMLFIDKILI